MNIIIVYGRLTKDAEIKTSSNGIKYLSFTLAKSEKVTKYFNVVSYDPYTIIRQEKDNFYNKGKFVIVSGHLVKTMSIKNSKTYLYRNIMAHSIELGTYYRIVEMLKEEEFGGYVSITDLEYKYQGACIDNIVLNIDNTLHFWGGNPLEDDHAEEILIPISLQNKILQDLVDMYC